MTFTFKQINGNGYYINIEQDKYSTLYQVNLCTDYGNGLVSAFKTYTYDTIQKANRRYNQLVKEYIYGMN